MRRLMLMIMILLLAIPFVTNADTWTVFYQKTSDGYGNPIATGNNGKPFQTFSCQIISSDNATAITAITVQLQGNQDCGSLYGVMAEHPLTAAELGSGIGAFSAVNMPVMCIRGRVLTLTGGTAPKITMKCTGVI